MSSFAKSSFNAVNYLSARPTYPDSLLKYIYSYFKRYNGNVEGSLACVDVGCGPGEATVKLANYFDKVTGIDPSPKMVEAAIKNNVNNSKINFLIGNDKTLSNLVPTNSANIVTSAQAVHWFDFPKFMNSSYGILKSNGTLALWGYVDHFFIDHPKANELTLLYSYGDDYMGPYWELPGRNRIRDMLIEPENYLRESNKFSNIEVYRDSSPIISSDSFFQMTKTVPLKSVQDYMKTFSAYHEWKLHHPDLPDITDVCFDAIKSAENWTDDTQVTIKWATMLILATKS